MVPPLSGREPEPGAGAPAASGVPAPDGGPEPIVLLGPEGERPFDAASIERELRAMWKAAAPEGGALYRAALANVVVPLDRDRSAPLEPVLAEFMRRHPSRLLRIEQIPRGADGPGGARLHARATALCHVRPGGGGLVCSEQIVLAAGTGAAPLVPSAVASLVVGDLPVILVRLDPAASPGCVEALEEAADVILEDSATRDDAAEMAALWGRLEREGSGRLHDVAWARLQPWRELLTEVFDLPEASAAVAEIQELAIRYGGAAPPAGAWLLAGWLASRLGWTLRERAGARFRFDGPRRAVTLHFERDEAVADAVLTALHARSGGPDRLDVRISHRGHEPTATVEFLAPSARSEPRRFRYRAFAACLVGEIHRHEPNATFERAARLAASLAGRGSRP